MLVDSVFRTGVQIGLACKGSICCLLFLMFLHLLWEAHIFQLILPNVLQPEKELKLTWVYTSWLSHVWIPVLLPTNKLFPAVKLQCKVENISATYAVPPATLK